MWQPGWERSLGENGYVYMYAESLYCLPETIALLISYTPIGNKKLKKKNTKVWKLKIWLKGTDKPCIKSWHWSIAFLFIGASMAPTIQGSEAAIGRLKADISRQHSFFRKCTFCHVWLLYLKAHPLYPKQYTVLQIHSINFVLFTWPSTYSQ